MTTPDATPHVNGDAGTTEEMILALGGGDIYVCQDGPQDAPAVLLIHGSGASTRSWDPLVPLLSTSHRVIRVDLLGHGRSAKPADGDYEIPDQGRRVGLALDRLGAEPAVVAGHSSGGYTATALAEQRPELVTALALIDTGPSLDAFIAPDSAEIGPSQWPHLSDEQIREIMASAFSRAGYEPPSELIDDVRAMTFHSFATTMQASRAYLERQTIPDRLMALNRPLLVIFGEDDRRWRSSSAADYRAVPGARVELLPGLGHSPILEDPPRPAAHLLAFTQLHAGRA